MSSSQSFALNNDDAWDQTMEMGKIHDAYEESDGSAVGDEDVMVEYW
jgi:hypothetical protein